MTLIKILCLAMALTPSASMAEMTVDATAIPDGGIQPKVVTDHTGATHLVYYRGDPSSGNLFHARRSTDGGWETLHQINSVADSAVSMGTIRGAQAAIDSDGIIHVVWNGSQTGSAKDSQHPPMWYARSLAGGNGFSPQQPISGDWPVDGGGAVAVDSKDAIFVFWHSAEEIENEQDRRVYMRTSRDRGKTFSEPRAISPSGSGVCSCCSMQASADSDDSLYVVYRTADGKGHRDIALLVSRDEGNSFDDTILDEWVVATCPMSSMAILETPNAMLVGWETDGQVRIGTIRKGTVSCEKIVSPRGSRAMKHPTFAKSDDNKVLMAWTEGTGWNKGGAIAWQIVDQSLTPIADVERIPSGVSTWSFVDAFYSPTAGRFYIVH